MGRRFNVNAGNSAKAIIRYPDGCDIGEQWLGAKFFFRFGSVFFRAFTVKQIVYNSRIKLCVCLILTEDDGRRGKRVFLGHLNQIVFMFRENGRIHIQGIESFLDGTLPLA